MPETARRLASGAIWVDAVSADDAGAGRLSLRGCPGMASGLVWIGRQRDIGDKAQIRRPRRRSSIASACIRLVTAASVIIPEPWKVAE